MKRTNLLERLNEKIKCRTHVVRIFPNADACLRRPRAVGAAPGYALRVTHGAPSINLYLCRICTT